MSAASREPFLCAAQITRQDRYDDDCQEAHGSPPRSQHGRELQAPGHDRANLTAEIASAISYQLSGKNLVRKAAFGCPAERSSAALTKRTDAELHQTHQRIKPATGKRSQGV